MYKYIKIHVFTDEDKANIDKALEKHKDEKFDILETAKISNGVYMLLVKHKDGIKGYYIIKNKKIDYICAFTNPKWNEKINTLDDLLIELVGSHPDL